MDKNKIPQHIAIIMDGNGRWAKKRGLPRFVGHRRGVESIRTVLKACASMGVKYLTVYAFSTENWGRPQEEIDFLMNLLSTYIRKEIKGFMKNKVKVNFLGRISQFPVSLYNEMTDAMEKTSKNDGITLNIMVNYGGRAEIVDAINKIIEKGKKAIDEETIGQHLYTKGVPDPDLLIRTASEMRISNFLLWQIAYAELYVTPVLWPDFRKDQLVSAIEEYQKRIRKFGKTEEQLYAS
jgi:undecaprenyl diphosphate synthase